jgi:hypothetical protein
MALRAEKDIAACKSKINCLACVTPVGQKHQRDKLQNIRASPSPESCTRLNKNL